MFLTESGCPTCDKALERIIVHIKKYKDYESFESGLLLSIDRGKADDATLIKWLLKVNYSLVKQQENQENTDGYRFETLLSRQSQENREKMKKWLDTKIKETGG